MHDLCSILLHLSSLWTFNSFIPWGGLLTITSHFKSLRASDRLITYIQSPLSTPFLRPRTQRQKRFIPRPTKCSPNPTRRKINYGIRIRRPPRNRLRHRHIIRRRDIHLAITPRAARVLWVYADDVVDAGDVVHVRYGLEAAVAVVGTGNGGGDGGGVGSTDGDGGVDAG